jgi:hypothetical protein
VYLLAGELKLLQIITSGELLREVFIIYGRASSASLALVALASLYDIGRRLGSPLAGLLAAGFIGVFPEFVSHAHLIKPDIASFSMVILALWAAVVALDRGSDRGDWWLALSLLAGLVAFVAKYTALAAVGIAPLAAIAKYFNRPRKLLKVGGLLALGVLVGMGFLHWRIDLVAALFNIHKQKPQTTEGLAERITSLQLVGFERSLDRVIGGAGLLTLAVALVLLPVVLTLRRRWTPTLVRKLVVVVGLGLAVVATMAFFPVLYQRYFLVTYASIGLLWGLALAWLLPRRYAPLVLIPALFVLFPNAQDSWKLIERLDKPDTLAIGTNWFVENVPQGARIGVDGQARQLYFNRYTGYDGPMIYTPEIIDALPEHSIAEYQNGGMEYLVTAPKESREYFLDPERLEGGEYEVVAEIDSEERRGPHLLILSVPPRHEHVRYLWLGDVVSFRGYDLPRTELQPGSVLEFTLYWMSVRVTTANYVVEARLVDLDGEEVVARHETEPDGGHRPTSTWEGGMQFVPDEHLFVLPGDVPPGTYDLQIALYDAATGERLPVSNLDGQTLGESFSLGDITIK